MHMFYRIMKGIYQFAANLHSYIPTKYYWNRSTSDLVIAKSKRVNFFWNTVYIVSFARYRDLLVEYRKIVVPHLYLVLSQGVTPSEFLQYRPMILIKLEWLGYRVVKKNYNTILCRFHRIPGRNGQTNKQTNRPTDRIILLYQYRASVCWRAITKHQTKSQLVYNIRVA